MPKLLFNSVILAGIILPALVHANGNWSLSTLTEGNSRIKRDAYSFNQGNVLYTGKFFNNVVKDRLDTSVVMSPYSSLFLLAQVAMYASGQALTELLSLLRVQNKDEITTSVPEILNSIEHQQNVIFKTAAKSFINTEYTLKDSFKLDTKKYFKAEAENIDFTNPSKAAEIINSWVAGQTNNRIKNLISPSALSPGTQIVLANAIYFKGEWIKKFEKSRTKPADFNLLNGRTVRVDMMNNQDTFKYSELENLNAKAVELEYVNRNFSFLVILSNIIDNNMDLLQKLGELDSIGSIRQQMEYQKVNVFLPKFETTTSLDLKDVLEKVGIKEIFNPATTGLSGITENSEALFVSSALQKANIIVDERGSEASAASSFILVGASFNPTPAKVFNANHPFVYYILFQGTPVFCGIYAGN